MRGFVVPCVDFNISLFDSRVLVELVGVLVEYFLTCRNEDHVELDLEPRRSFILFPPDFFLGLHWESRNPVEGVLGPSLGRFGRGRVARLILSSCLGGARLILSSLWRSWNPGN